MISKRIGAAFRTRRLHVAVCLAALVVVVFLDSCKKKEVPAAGESAPAGEAKSAAGAPVSAQVVSEIGASSDLRKPLGVTVDGSGNVYVVDTGNNRVVKFDPSGKELLRFGEKGAGPGQFVQARAAAVSPQGNVLVLDSETSWINVFTPAGKFLSRMGGSDLGLYHPAGFAVAPDGTVFVADTGGSRILPINPDGTSRPPLATAGKERLSQPTDIYVDPHGGLHVYQTAGEKTPSVFYHLTSAGELEGKWAAPEASSTFDTPRAALAADGSIYVTDPQKQQVRVYEANGSAFHPLQIGGAEPPHFQTLSAIAVDGHKHVYVVDAGANLVYCLQVSGQR